MYKVAEKKKPSVIGTWEMFIMFWDRFSICGPG